MNSVDLTYQIGLTLLDGVGDVLAKNLVAYCGSAEQVFKTKKAQLEKIPSKSTATAFVLSKKTLSVPGKDLLFDLSFTPSFTSAKVWA